MSKPIPFSQNWNNKLDCEYFTTVRYWAGQYKTGDVRQVSLNDQIVKTCQVVGFALVKLDQIGSLTSYTDAGLAPEEFRAMMRRMYKNKPVPPDEADFAIVLLKTLTDHRKGGTA